MNPPSGVSDMFSSLSMFHTSVSLPSSTYLLWYLAYALIFALFYVFSSPFTGNRELRKSWSGYVYVSTTLYIWLSMAVALHLPILHYDVKVPVSLFSPLFLASALALFLAEGATKILNRWFVFHVGFRQHSLEVFQNAFVTSLAICLVYSQCGSVTNAGLQLEWSRANVNSVSSGGGIFASLRNSPEIDLVQQTVQHVVEGASEAAANIIHKFNEPDEKGLGIDQMCIYLFSGHVNSRYAHLPMVFVLWCTAVSALVVNFVIERISGYRGMFQHYSSARVNNSNLEESPAAVQRRAAATPSSASSSTPLTANDQSAEAKEKAHAKADPRFANMEGSAAQDLLDSNWTTRKLSSGTPGSATATPELLSVASSSYKAGTSYNMAPVAPAASSAQSYKNNLRRIRPVLFRDMMDPPMLEMVPWYALLTTFTGVDLLIHLKLFVGRFDMRTLQAVTPNSFHYTQPLYPDPAHSGQLPGAGYTSSNSLHGLGEAQLNSEGGVGGGFSSNSSTATTPLHTPRGLAAGVPLGGVNFASSSQQFRQQNNYPSAAALHPFHVHQHHLDAPLVYDHCAEDEELWFDWMADCGDGWNSSYQVARCVAKPLLNVSVRRKGGRKPGALRLPRSKILLIGGDLAYPSPSPQTYETRFFRPFQCALPPPLNYDPSALSMHKPPIPGGVSGLKDYKGPTCFAMAGNHDWFDGLQTYIRYICCRDWLGGWLMPQERSFFALQLPKGWWLFGLDNALSDDIDALQFKYFASIIERMGDDDRVIIATHEPQWIIDCHDQKTTGENTNYLIKMLKGKVALRIAGDLHNYTRHMPSPLVQGVRTTIKTQMKSAFAASAASSLFKGVLDSIFSPKESEDEETVSGVVDATLNRAQESARIMAEEQAEIDAQQAAAAQAAGSGSGGGGGHGHTQQQVSYTSMLYSRFTSYGGDGEGIFLEDILDTLNPATPLLRTQSMPSMLPVAAVNFTVTPPLPRAGKHLGGTDLGLGHAEEGEETAEGGAQKAKQHRNKNKAHAMPPKARPATEQKSKRAIKHNPAPVKYMSTRDSASLHINTNKNANNKQPQQPSTTILATAAASNASITPPTAPILRTVNASSPTENAPTSTFSPSALSSWTTDDVIQWMRSCGWTDETLHASFRSQHITGRLLKSLDVHDLQELGMHSGLARKKFIIEIKELKQHFKQRRQISAAAEEGENETAKGGEAADSHANSSSTLTGATGEDEEDEEDMEDEEEDDEDISSSGSENEQLTRDILSGSILNLSQKAGAVISNSSSGTSLDAKVGEESQTPPPTNALHQQEAQKGSNSHNNHKKKHKKNKKKGSSDRVPDLMTLPSPPVPLYATPKSASGPNLTTTEREIDPNFAFFRQNVDLVTLSPTQSLSVENAAQRLDSLHRQESFEGKTIGAAPTVPTLNSPHSAALQAKRKHKKKTSLPSSNSSSASNLEDMVDSTPPTPQRTLAAARERVVINQSPLSAVHTRQASASAFDVGTLGKEPPRRPDVIFGPSAVGPAAVSGTSTGSNINGGLPPIPRTPQRSPALRPSASPVLRPVIAPGGSPFHPATGTGTALYNNAESAPIPTDLKESINVPFPEGSSAPREIYLKPEDLDVDTDEDDGLAEGNEAFGGGITGTGVVGGKNVSFASGVTDSSSTAHVRPPPVLIVSGGGGAFMHPTHVPDPDPILFRGNRYVRASSYPPVALSRAYALLNLFGFRKQNWRFDMFGGVLYFLFVFSVLPVCNLDHILQSSSWYDVAYQYLVAVYTNWALIFSTGYISLICIIALWLVLVNFAEVAWPFYKKLIVGTLHALAHSIAAVGALVLMETVVELGLSRKVIGQGDVLYSTFTKSFPAVASVVDQADTQLYGIVGYLARFISNVFDVPDNLAHYKQLMCNSYGTMTRAQVLLYYFNVSLYLWVLMTPLVSFMFGAFLYIGSAFLCAFYTESYSSLRIEGYKNFVRLHINREGGLEIYVLGIDRVPKAWVKDRDWSGHTAPTTSPSHEWANPSIIKPEPGQPDRIKLIDYLLINRNPRNKSSFVKQANLIAASGGSGRLTGPGAVPTAPQSTKASDSSAAAPLFPSPATSQRGVSIRELVAPASPQMEQRSLAGNSDIGSKLKQQQQSSLNSNLLAPLELGETAFSR